MVRLFRPAHALALLILIVCFARRTIDRMMSFFSSLDRFLLLTSFTVFRVFACSSGVGFVLNVMGTVSCLFKVRG